jgi:putative glycosyltransferase (TIGR04348 family)
MHITIVTPMGSGSQTGNKATANRWANLISQLGHEVDIAPCSASPTADLLIAIHAGHSAKAIARFRKTFPERPVVLAAAGTDLYRDIHVSKLAQASLEIADRIVVLQPRAMDEIPKRYHKKCRIVFQSAVSPKHKPTPIKKHFEVCVIGHLRPVKDPFRAAFAVRNLPEESKIKIIHLGGALSDSMEAKAVRETQQNPNYEWLGEVPHSRAMKRLLRSRLLVHSSKTEGGANVITEAIVAGVPILSSAIPGSIGLLGDDYPGYFETGNTNELRDLLLRAETDAKFTGLLQKAVVKRQKLFTPRVETQTWKKLLAEILGPGAQTRSKKAGTKTGTGTAADVKSALKKHINPKKAAFFPRFFKTGKRQYGEGDKFIGVTVPFQRQVAKRFKTLPEREIKKLLDDPIHEHRLTGLLILVLQFEKSKEVARREQIVRFYLDNLDRVNNWDLVDSSAHKILGVWLLKRDRAVLYELAESGHLWSERVSVIACLPLIKDGDFDDILRLAKHFLTHKHDLIHKAVGWMLREMGQYDEASLIRFLAKHYKKMPRTMLRYSIEKLPPAQRRAYIEGRV